MPVTSEQPPVDGAFLQPTSGTFKNIFLSLRLFSPQGTGGWYEQNLYKSIGSYFK